MTGREALQKVTESRTPEQLFVKWNRKENDFVDYDLVDRFIENLSDTEQFENVDLLTMEEMFAKVKSVAGDRVRILDTTKGKEIEWKHSGKSGAATQTCPYTPASLMTIFDVETKDDAID